MECPDFPLADELKVDIDSTEAMWGLFEEFNSGLADLAKEDWISFRSATQTLNLNYCITKLWDHV